MHIKVIIYIMDMNISKFNYIFNIKFTYNTFKYFNSKTFSGISFKLIDAKCLKKYK